MAQHVTQLDLLKDMFGDCKEPLPAPGNRSNERRYREKDLATTGKKKVGTGREGERWQRKRGVVKSRRLNDVS
ncbi:hypothetical protein TNCV_291371 [Trichonephila clavipes]|nr:hypothetical protein TNCV_291371 [Trichonephila clavipes]